MENEKDDIPSNFVLRIEEKRMVRDIGGGEVMEIRWRPPTKAEVCEIVRRYHEVQAKLPPLDMIELGSNYTRTTATPLMPIAMATIAQLRKHRPRRLNPSAS
jgi:hypothetical protein